MPNMPNMPNLMRKRTVGSMNSTSKLVTNTSEKAVEFRRRIDGWMINDGKRHLFVVFWIILQCTIFGVSYMNYSQSEDYKVVLGGRFTSIIFKASTINIHTCVGLILLPVCRTLISFLRTTPLNRIIPFDDAHSFHRLIAFTFLSFGLLHIVAVGFHIRSKNPTGPFLNLWFAHGPYITGNLMALCLILIALASIPVIVRNHFEVFWYTHHLAFVFFFLASMHGSWCTDAADREPRCESSSTFWKFWTFSGILYSIERILRELRSRRQTHIIKVVQHQSDVIEVQFRRSDITYKAGQYVFLCCPEISLLQWHPFTLTSSPEEDHMSVHIRPAGNFTNEFARRLGCTLRGDVKEGKENKWAGGGNEIDQHARLPLIQIDGPFGSASEDVFKYEVISLFAAGIGVTPFASVLKSIWYRIQYPTSQAPIRLRKVRFFWICRDYRAVEWFKDLLGALEDEDTTGLLDIRVYLTGPLNPQQIHNVTLNDSSHPDGGFEDALTGLRAPTFYGRPNMDRVFSQMVTDFPDTHVGVFCCGPKPLSRSIHVAANRHSQTEEDGTKFSFNKENF